MRRYILHSLPGYDTGMLNCTVDSLDDIIGDEMEAIDTQTGDIYVYTDKNKWELTGNADDKIAPFIRRKSDKPKVITGDTEEADGGYLLPCNFREMIGGVFAGASVIPIQSDKISIPFLERPAPSRPDDT